MNQSSKLSLTRPMHLIQQLKLWKALDFSGESFLTVANVLCIYFSLKPGLGISCKNRKHMFADTFLLSFLRMPWSSHSCNDRRYSCFTRNICNRYADCFKILSNPVLKHVCTYIGVKKTSDIVTTEGHLLWKIITYNFRQSKFSTQRQ